MAYTGTGINTSATIVEAAGAAADYRGKAVKYDESGCVVLAGAGEVVMGVGIITNAEETKAGEDVDIQVKEIGLGRAGAAIAKGAELAADADGNLVEAGSGFVIGVALESAEAAGKFIRMQIVKYYKSGSAASTESPEVEPDTAE